MVPSSSPGASSSGALSHRRERCKVTAIQGRVGDWQGLVAGVVASSNSELPFPDVDPIAGDSGRACVTLAAGQRSRPVHVRQAKVDQEPRATAFNVRSRRSDQVWCLTQEGSGVQGAAPRTRSHAAVRLASRECSRAADHVATARRAPREQTLFAGVHAPFARRSEPRWSERRMPRSSSGATSRRTPGPA